MGNIQNLFGREPEDAGLIYWAGILKSGATTPGTFIATIINAAYEGRDGASVDDWKNMHIQIQVAEYFTDQLSAVGIAWSDVAFQAAAEVMVGIGGDSDITASKQMVDALIGNLQ